MCSTGCWQPAAAAAAPETPTILKKSRRFMRSVMTRHALERRLHALRVLGTMTVDAPAHRQRRRCRAYADEDQEVVGQPRPCPRADGRHRLHGSMTDLALHAGAHVGLVRE